MGGYVAQRRGRFYAVIHESRDPVTGRGIRRWHPAGTDRAGAERLTEKLAAEAQKKSGPSRGLDLRRLPDQPGLPVERLTRPKQSVARERRGNNRKKSA